MRRLEAGAAAAAMAAAMVLGAGAGPSAAQQGDEAPPLVVSPTSGPPGTVITIDGDACISDLMEIVDIELVGGDVRAEGSVSHFGIDDETGEWTGQVTVPAEADPDDTFVINVTCNFLGPEDNHELVFAYPPVDFDVTASIPTTPPTTAPDPGPPAPPAQPVPGEPTFTG